MAQKRKKKKARARRKATQPGKVVKISHEVYTHVKKNSVGKSIDATLRRLLGLPDRKGELGPAPTYWVLKRPHLQVFETKSAANGAAILASVATGKARIETPTKVRELPKASRKKA